jgi:hypothetical protein
LGCNKFLTFLCWDACSWIQGFFTDEFIEPGKGKYRMSLNVGAYASGKNLYFGTIGTFKSNKAQQEAPQPGTPKEKAERFFFNLLKGKFEPQRDRILGEFEWNGKTYPAVSRLIRIGLDEYVNTKGEETSEPTSLTDEVLNILMIYDDKKPYALVYDHLSAREQYIFPLTPLGDRLIRTSVQNPKDEVIPLSEYDSIDIVRLIADKVLHGQSLFGKNIDIPRYQANQGFRLPPLINWFSPGKEA